MKTAILELKSSPYENGKISGEYFKNPIQKQINSNKEIYDNEDIIKRCKIISDELKKQFPNYYEEIKGKAFGAEVEFDKYFILMCPEILETKSHCTTITCKKNNGKFILSHNEDDNYEENNFCLSKVYIDNKNWFMTNDIYNMPFGNGFSWNSYGIIKTINYCYESNVEKEKIPRYFSQRHISEAKSIDDLIKRCNELRPASGYHINALDINNNIAVSIEVYPDYIDVEYINDYYIHSNHYIHKEYKNNPKVDTGSNSIFRLQKATELFNKIENRNLENIKEILDYRDKSNCFEYSIFQTQDDPYITGMNFSYDNDDKKIIIDIYTTGEKLEFVA